ncbi:MAG: hypothetical protein WBL11_06490 [Bacteroidales bacterium]|jgi:FMN phosphatase YigB (HAD superfamily)|nr:hypothetical protein [Bacteroidales bacterium]MDI9576418.1 hypothetical protein [Bacteroidota bacterium]MDD2594033.1 hypothetical protein [Bacteroidales bacterium]MDD3754843.1 hypothetical protein [Bacteroidales bacterium]MDY0400117.1 hypothetical protein [Bacteroidales bacterium]
MRIFCDLDGVLTDFDGRFFELFGKYPNEFIDTYGYSSFWASFTRQAEDFWSGIKWKNDGKKLWQFIRPYNPIILSSVPPSMAKIATKYKEKWIRDELGLDIEYYITSRKEKQNYSDQGSILIDDMKKNIDEWLLRGGIGILHISAENTIKELKKIGL